ncbi:MAG: hypothetical protein ABJJ53_15915 [Sulfitobacter sp.]
MFYKTLIATTFLGSSAFADPAIVQSVSVSKINDAYTFNVTVLHSDKGWEDYADAWRIKDMNGTLLGERKLTHPHVNEQPFTRSLSGVRIPAGVDSVVVEVRDTVGGWAPKSKTVKLP